MISLYLTMGLPASGKSTWARNEVVEGNGSIKRVNKDSLRDMIDVCRDNWNKGKEEWIDHIERFIVESFLEAGFIVIVDDTNLDPAVRQRWREVAQNHGVEMSTVAFLDASMDTCISRDARRDVPVGSDVIRRMHDKWLAPHGALSGDLQS